METDYQTFKLRLFVPVNWFLLRAAVLWLLVPLCSNSKIHAVLSAVLFIYVIGVTITLLAVFSLYLEMKSTSWGKGGENGSAQHHYSHRASEAGTKVFMLTSQTLLFWIYSILKQYSVPSNQAQKLKQGQRFRRGKWEWLQEFVLKAWLRSKGKSGLLVTGIYF